MPPTAVDATVMATPPLEPTSRRRHHHAALPTTNAGCVVATALSNANANAGTAARRPAKIKAVASRYLTPSSKPTSVSISSPAKSPSPPPRTPASAGRSRPVLPNVAAATDAGGSGATTTTRTLAVAFQSPTYSLETSRASSASASPAAEPTVATPEPKMSTARAAKVSVSAPAVCAHVPVSAPAAARALGNSSTESSASSKKKETPTIAAVFGAVRSTAFRGTPRRASVDGANEYLLALSSNTDSASSSGGSGSGGDGGGAPRRSVGSSGLLRPSPAPRSAAMNSSARLTREDAMRTRSERFAYPATPSPSRASPAPAPVKKRSLFTGLLSSPFSRASPKQPPPSKPVAGAFRGAASPTPPRRSTEVPASAGNTQVKASSAGGGVDGDVKSKLPAAIKAEDEHQLRLLYTRELQWRLVNAQARAALSSQTMGAEKNLCGAWISILMMRKSVAIRKMQLQLLRNSCKVTAILKGHMKYLEEWSFLERDHAHSLSGTTQALTATVLRLPVSNGALADIQGIKNALSSAVDVMQTLGNSTRTQLPKLAGTNVLVSQLSRVFIQQHILITQCRDLLSTMASMHTQVRYSSLQGQRIQLNQTRPRHFQ